MPNITREDVRKLQNDPLSFAILMEDQYIEQVIVAFVSVLNKRKRNQRNRGD